VRRAVYEGTAAGWRLGAHERCAAALAARGEVAGARAHHVERSAREGDLAAVAVLREAGEAASRLAPASAAHWFASALRLLPSTTPLEDRVELLLAHAAALAAAGRFAESHEALVEALLIAATESTALRATLTTACARLEHRLGRYEQARARLLKELGGLPDPASAAAVDLMIELALNEFYRSRYESMRDWAGRTVTAADALGDPPQTATALAILALADAMTGSGDGGRSYRAEAAALVDGLSDEELSPRLDAAAWLAAAELYLDLYAEAEAHAARALALARVTGQGELFLVLKQVLSRALCVRAKLSDATRLLDEAIEGARLLGQTQALAGSLFNRSVIALAVGDLDAAVATARESFDLASDLDEGFVTAWAAVRLAGALLETGQAERALEVLIGCAGGDELGRIPGGWRAYCLELLTRCRLALGHGADAKRAAACAQTWAATVQLPLATAWADRAAAAVDLDAGDSRRAAARALDSAAAADEVGATIDAALARILAGRAMARAGERDRAVAELRRAAGELGGCGALRYRDEAEHELGKLGLRIHRRTRAGKRYGSGLESLTERELQVARLVVDRKTNPEIAAELFLSQKTVESHLRNVFRKLDVRSRVDLARVVERADGASRDQGAKSGGPPDVGVGARRQARPMASYLQQGGES
jgi:DNA-binding NarL/FixJ family response regulator